MGPENSTTESIINLRCYTVVAGEPDVGPRIKEIPTDESMKAQGNTNRILVIYWSTGNTRSMSLSYDGMANRRLPTYPTLGRDPKVQNKPVNPSKNKYKMLIIKCVNGGCHPAAIRPPLGTPNRLTYTSKRPQVTGIILFYSVLSLPRPQSHKFIIFLMSYLCGGTWERTL